MTETTNEKLYITKLRFHNHEKALYLVGENGDEGESKFQAAKESLTKVGDTSSEWEDFFERAVQHFKRLGFVRIEK